MRVQEIPRRARELSVKPRTSIASASVASAQCESSTAARFSFTIGPFQKMYLVGV